MPLMEAWEIEKVPTILLTDDGEIFARCTGFQPEEILEILLKGFDIEITDKSPVEFYCNCTKERVEKALISIGKKDLQELIEEGKEIEMNCHFCNTNYVFSVEELKEILKKVKR